MKPLPEQFDAENPNEAYLAALLERVQPSEPTAEQMQRVWTTLERSPWRRPRRRVSGPVIAGLLLCGATVASATMPHVWTRLQRDHNEEAAAPVATSTKAAPRRAAPVAPPPPVVMAEPTWETEVRTEPPAPQPVAVVRRATPSKARAPIAEPVDSLASAALMVEAVRERRAGNLARARELATEYRAKNPSGALYEEALALCFGAASALGDAEARPLAELYLQRYPRGRFHAQAQRVMDKGR